jgi:hypothetical protein
MFGKDSYRAMPAVIPARSKYLRDIGFVCVYPNSAASRTQASSVPKVVNCESTSPTPKTIAMTLSVNIGITSCKPALSCPQGISAGRRDNSKMVSRGLRVRRRDEMDSRRGEAANGIRTACRQQ